MFQNIFFLLTACGMLSGKLAIFDAVGFAAKPCFTADIGHRLTVVKFSPDPQHLIVTVSILCCLISFDLIF